MSSRPPRNAFIDHLRVVLTALVIFHHVAIVYGGSGGWYWREEPDSSNSPLVLFNAVNQSFFMGLFFLLAGYYTPKSYDRKGPAHFLGERFLRLGIPWLCYFFILSPMTIALARTSEGHPFWSGWLMMIHGGEFEPGPLWFAEALLLFALGYVTWRRLFTRPSMEGAPLAGFGKLILAAVGIGVFSFLIRLVVPVGKNVAWLQLGYFPGYIVLFVGGCMAARAQLLENVTFAQTKPWMILSVTMLILLPVVIATRGAEGSFKGGWTFNAAFYAFWDPFVAWGIILTLLWFFRTHCSRETLFTRVLAQRAYGAYIIHPPVIVALSLLARGWTAPSLCKFAVVGLAASVGSFAATSILLLLPGSRKIL